MNTVQYKCPNCGAELTFDPEHQNFNCEYCDTSYTEAEMQQLYQNMEQQANQNADAAAETLESENDDKAFENETRLYTCQNCGAQIIAEAETSATFCYYCHAPVVLAGRLTGEYKPAYVLPFAVTRDGCLEQPFPHTKTVAARCLDARAAVLFCAWPQGKTNALPQIIANVHGRAVQVRLEMQVVSICAARSAHITDELALLDRDAVGDALGPGGHMGVNGHQPAAMAQLDTGAVRVVCFCADNTVRRRVDFCTQRRGDIHAAVEFLYAVQHHSGGRPRRGGLHPGRPAVAGHPQAQL